MAQIFKGRVYGGSPYPSAEVNYEYTRDGANMKYHFWGKVYLENKNGWYYNNLRLKLYLNGSDIYTKDCKSSSKGWSIDFDSGWHTVSNKTSGTTPFYFTVKDTQNTGWCNYTSETYQLDVAPAYTSITGFSVSALSETSVRFYWSAADTVDYAWYSIDNGSNWSGVDVADGTSGHFDVGGLSANTGYNFKICVRRKDSQLQTYSNAYWAATYAYPYLTSVPEFTVGNNLTIGIYNPLGRSCTISVIGDNGVEHNGGTITGTTISQFNNDGWKNIWYSTLPNKTQGTYKARLVCSTGNINQLSNAVNYYLNTSDTGFKPTFTANEVINIVNTANTTIAGSNKFIKNHNSLSGVIKPMIPNRSASGSYYNVSTSGLATVRKDYSSSNINFVLGNMSSNTFNVTAVDSRGFSTTISKAIDLVDYNNPGVTTSKITRQNGISTKAVLAFTGVYTNWAGLLKTNSIQSIRYKIGASGTWKSLPSNATLTSSNGVWTLNAVLDDTFATTSQYDLYLEIKDLLETVVVGAYTISTADAFIWKDLANKRMGINKKPFYELDVNGQVYAENGFIGKLYNLDTRNDNQPPKWYMSKRGISNEFKSANAIGLNWSNYCNLITITPWGDSSGGGPVQIAIHSGGDMAQRIASTDNDWGSWQYLNGTRGKTIKTRNTVGTLDWVNIEDGQSKIPDVSCLAHWNGAYSGSASNLLYCDKGAFNTAITLPKEEITRRGHFYHMKFWRQSYTWDGNWQTIHISGEGGGGYSGGDSLYRRFQGQISTRYPGAYLVIGEITVLNTGGDIELRILCYDNADASEKLIAGGYHQTADGWTHITVAGAITASGDANFYMKCMKGQGGTYEVLDNSTTLTVIKLW